MQDLLALRLRAVELLQTRENAQRLARAAIYPLSQRVGFKQLLTRIYKSHEPHGVGELVKVDPWAVQITRSEVLQNPDTRALQQMMDGAANVLNQRFDTWAHARVRAGLQDSAIPFSPDAFTEVVASLTPARDEQPFVMLNSETYAAIGGGDASRRSLSLDDLHLMVHITRQVDTGEVLVVSRGPSQTRGSLDVRVLLTEFEPRGADDVTLGFEFGACVTVYGHPRVIRLRL